MIDLIGSTVQDVIFSVPHFANVGFCIFRDKKWRYEIQEQKRSSGMLYRHIQTHFEHYVHLILNYTYPHV
jgi:hypothetical protein